MARGYGIEQKAEIDQRLAGRRKGEDWSEVRWKRKANKTRNRQK